MYLKLTLIINNNTRQRKIHKEPPQITPNTVSNYSE